MFRDAVEIVPSRDGAKLEFDGAGTRDRTEDTSLEGWGFTTKLCPRPKSLNKPVERIGSSWNSQSGLFRSKAPITS